MARVRRVRSEVAPHDSARRVVEQYGVRLFFGEGRFVGPDAVEVRPSAWDAAADGEKEEGQKEQKKSKKKSKKKEGKGEKREEGDEEDEEETEEKEEKEEKEEDGGGGGKYPVLRFHRACIATGARPAVPDVPGLGACGYLTAESIFNIDVLPRRLAVVGGGAVGCELGQAFAVLGAEVHLLARSAVLPREEPDAAALVERQMRLDGVRVLSGARLLYCVRAAGAEGAAELERARQCGDLVHPMPSALAEKKKRGEGGGEKEGEEEKEAERLARFEESHAVLLRFGTPDGATHVLWASAVLLACGRRANVDGLALGAAGLRKSRLGRLEVSDTLQCAGNSRVYAAGDVCTEFQFTHMADAMARIVLRNALFLGRGRASALQCPWTTFTEPEISHIGLYESDCRGRGVAFVAFQRNFADLDRAIADRARTVSGLAETEMGFVRVLVREGTDEILGATVVGGPAGELLGEVALAMRQGLGLAKMAAVIHAYPTYGAVWSGLADDYNRTKLTPKVKVLFRSIMKTRAKMHKEK